MLEKLGCTWKKHYTYDAANRQKDIELTRMSDDKSEYFHQSNCYDAFGDIFNESGDTLNRFTYTGQMYDGVMWQYYLQTRFYNTSISRFIQEDVYRGDELNLYAYCANNPVIYLDPSGYRTM